MTETVTCNRRRHSVWTNCPCPPCTADRRRMSKIARTGRYRRVSSDAAYTVVGHLLDRGWTGLAIATASGVPATAVHGILSSYRAGGEDLRRIGPTVAAAIVSHGNPTDGHVGSHGARRRLRALAAIGWTLDELATASGIGFSTLAAVRAGQTGRVKVWLHDAVVELYAAHEMRPGPSDAARNLAQRKSWASPLAWDAEDLDDVEAEPVGLRKLKRYRDGDVDPVVVDKVMRHERVEANADERREAARRWVAAGRPLTVLGDEQGWNVHRYVDATKAAS